MFLIAPHPRTTRTTLYMALLLPGSSHLSVLLLYYSHNSEHFSYMHRQSSTAEPKWRDIAKHRQEERCKKLHTTVVAKLVLEKQFSYWMWPSFEYSTGIQPFYSKTFPMSADRIDAASNKSITWQSPLALETPAGNRSTEGGTNNKICKVAQRNCRRYASHTWAFKSHPSQYRLLDAVHATHLQIVIPSPNPPHHWSKRVGVVCCTM